MRFSWLLQLLPLAAGLHLDSDIESLGRRDLATTIATLPQCALPCLLAAVGNSTCTLTDQDCICATPTIEQQASICIARSCTVMEAFHTKNATERSCNRPIRNVSAQFNTMNLALGITAAVIVLLRLFFRLRIVPAPLGADDVMLYVAFITCVPSTVMNVVCLTANGLGQDIWTLDDDTITNFIKYFYIMQLTYFLHLYLLKTAMLLFYLRIFPGSTIRRCLWATMGVNALGGLIFIFVTIFQCTPITFYWDRLTHPDPNGHCLNINAIGWSSAVFNIAVDLWMLAIPLWQLRTLQMHWKKKLGVAVMFCVGTFVTVVSILRLQSLLTFANSRNPTWDQVGIATWSTIEINVALICACMPAMRAMLVRLFPFVFGGTSVNKSEPYARASGFVSLSRMAPGSRAQTTMRGNRVEISRDGPSPTSQLSGQFGGIAYSKSFVVDYEAEVDDRSVASLQHHSKSKAGSAT